MYITCNLQYLIQIQLGKFCTVQVVEGRTILWKSEVSAFESIVLYQRHFNRAASSGRISEVAAIGSVRRRFHCIHVPRIHSPIVVHMTNIFPYFIVCVARLAQSYVTVANQIVYTTIGHSTQKPTERHQILPSPCAILKVIHAGVGWVWLARLMCLYILPGSRG